MSESIIVLGALLFFAGLFVEHYRLNSELTIWLKNIPYVERISGQADVMLIFLGFLLIGLGC